MQMILASQSPRRRELLGLLNLPFSVEVADVDETMDADKPVAAEVARVSRSKAEAIVCGQEDIVIAADTIVVCDNAVLGKPKDEADAFRMLKMLSGRSHEVMTGLTVKKGEHSVSCTEITHIRFRPLTDQEIWDYIATGEPMDKAGSYGIQGGAAVFAEHLEGDYYNVMGLPVCKLYKILRGMMEESQ